MLATDLKTFLSFFLRIYSSQSHGCDVVKRIPCFVNELDLHTKFYFKFSKRFHCIGVEQNPGGLGSFLISNHLQERIK